MQENNKKRKIILEFYHMDMCPKCKQVALEIYDIWNNPIGYRHIIDAYEAGRHMPEGLLNKREFYTIRCKKCGACYQIIWDHGFPFPMSSPIDKHIFLQLFKQGKGESE